MRLRTRLLALPLIAGFAATLAPSIPAGAEVTDPARAASAVSWLTAQTNPDGMLASFGTHPDPGLTLDAVLGGLAAKAPKATVDGWLDSLETGFKTRVIYDNGFGELQQDTGLIAKAVVALDAAGHSTTAYGGLNPQQLVLDSFTQGAEPGWAGSPTGPESVNAFGQGYAMIAAANVRKLPAASVRFLADVQCDGGGFPMYFTPSDTCNPDPDGTALLVMGLRAAKQQGITQADAPLNKAVNWLASMQRANGSYFGAVPFTAVENSNTSGLVAAALSDLKPDTVAGIRGWITGMQQSNGAIGYDTKVAADGITVNNRGTWVRSTAQGLLAFAPISFHQLEASSAPAPEPSVKYERTAPYTLEGEHTVNGRQWRTECEPYSKTERCRAEIWALVVHRTGNAYSIERGWAFNNLTYLPFLKREQWSTNPLGGFGQQGFNKEFTGTDGQRWRTECDTATSGRNGCRAYRMTTVYNATPRAAGGYAFSQESKWVFNNIVLFGDPSWR